MKAGDNLILVLTFNLQSPMRDHIKYVLSKGSLSSELCILAHDQAIKVDILSFEPVLQGTGMLFATSTSAQQRFANMWQQYTDRYDWDPMVDQLPLVSNNHINGYLVEHYDDGDGHKSSPVFTLKRMDKFKDDFIWILNNTQGKVWWSKMFWLFELSADAALFKLQQ